MGLSCLVSGPCHYKYLAPWFCGSWCSFFLFPLKPNLMLIGMDSCGIYLKSEQWTGIALFPSADLVNSRSMVLTTKAKRFLSKQTALWRVQRFASDENISAAGWDLLTWRRKYTGLWICDGLCKEMPRPSGISLYMGGALAVYNSQYDWSGLYWPLFSSPASHPPGST